jgi:hypothetical protein
MPTPYVGSGEDTGSNRREPLRKSYSPARLAACPHEPITFLGVVDVGCSNHALSLAFASASG